MHDDYIVTSYNHASTQLVAGQEYNCYQYRERLHYKLGTIINPHEVVVPWQHTLTCMPELACLFTFILQCGPAPIENLGWTYKLPLMLIRAGKIELV